MFGSKSLLSCKRAGSICLYFATKSNKTKEISVLGVVNYNKENKHLFGELLETRAQRRRTLKKVNRFKFRHLNKHANEIIGKVLNATLRESRFFTISKIHSKLNVPNYCSFSSNKFRKNTALFILLPHSKPSSGCIPLLPRVLCSNDVGGSIENRCAASDMSKSEEEECSDKKVMTSSSKLVHSIEPPNNRKSYTYKFSGDFKFFPVQESVCSDDDMDKLCALNSLNKYHSKVNHRILSNVSFKPYSLAKRFIHRQTNISGYRKQHHKNQEIMKLNFNNVSSSKMFHNVLNEHSSKISSFPIPAEISRLKKPNVIDNKCNKVQFHNVHGYNGMADQLYKKKVFSLYKTLETNLGYKNCTISNSKVQCSNKSTNQIKKSSISFNSSDDKEFAGSKLSISSNKNQVIGSNCHLLSFTHHGIESQDLFHRYGYFTNKPLGLHLTAWSNQIPVNKKSIFSIVNSKGIHSYSTSKPRNDWKTSRNKPKNTIKFIDESNHIPFSDYFRSKSLKIDEQEENADSNWLRSNSVVEGAEDAKGKISLVSKQSLKHGKTQFAESVRTHILKTMYSKNNDNVAAKNVGHKGLFYAKSRENKSKPSRDNFSKISHFIQKKDSNRIDLKSQSHLKQYFQKNSDISKSITMKNFPSKLSPHESTIKSTNDPSIPLKNASRLNFSFLPDRLNTKDISHIEKFEVQQRYVNENKITSLLFPKKKNRCEDNRISSYFNNEKNGRFAFKVHNNSLKASDDSSFNSFEVTKRPSNIRLKSYDETFSADNNEQDNEFKVNENMTQRNRYNISKIMNSRNVLEDNNIIKYGSLFERQNPTNNNNIDIKNHHHDFDQLERKETQISGLLFKRKSRANAPNLNHTAEYCALRTPELSSDFNFNVKRSGKKDSERNVNGLFDRSHSHKKRTTIDPFFEVSMHDHIKQTLSSKIIHCNDLNLNESVKKSPAQNSILADSIKYPLKRSKTYNTTIEKAPNTLANIEADQKRTKSFFEGISENIKSMTNTNCIEIDISSKKSSNNISLNNKIGGSLNHDNFKFMKQEKSPLKFHYLLNGTNDSSSPIIPEKLGGKLMDPNSGFENKVNILYKNNYQRSSDLFGNIRSGNDSKDILRYNHNNTHLKNSVENEVFSYSPATNSKLMNLFEISNNSKQNEVIAQETRLNNFNRDSIENNQRNTQTSNREFIFQDFESKLKFPFKPFPFYKNANLIANDHFQSTEYVNNREQFYIQNSVFEKFEDRVGISNLCNTPYYSTLGPQKSDFGNDFLNFQNSIGEQMNATRPYSIFGKAPYYHSINENNSSHGKVSKYSYSIYSSESPEPHLSDNTYSVCEDSFEFRKKIGDDMMKSDSIEIATIASKFEKKGRMLDVTNKHSSTELNSKKVKSENKIDSLMREKEVIAYDLKAIIEFCLSLNIPPKTIETSCKDDSKNWFDEIDNKTPLNSLKTLVETSKPKNSPESNNHLNKEDFENVTKVTPGCNIDNFRESSYTNDAHNIRESISNMSSYQKDSLPIITDNIEADYSECSRIESSEIFPLTKIIDENYKQLDKASDELVPFNRYREFFELCESNVKNPFITYISNSKDENLSHSFNSGHEILSHETNKYDDSVHGDLVRINENQNHSLVLSNTMEYGQAEEELKKNSIVENHEMEVGESFSKHFKTVDEKVTSPNYKHMQEDYYVNSTSSWNYSDRIKYFKLTSSLRNAVLHKKAINKHTSSRKSKSKSFYDRMTCQSTSDREKFQNFSNFLKEAVIERENIDQKIASFKNILSPVEGNVANLYENNELPRVQNLIKFNMNENCGQSELSTQNSVEEGKRISGLCFVVNDVVSNNSRIIENKFEPEDESTFMNSNFACVSSSPVILRNEESSNIYIPNTQKITVSFIQSSNSHLSANFVPVFTLKSSRTRNDDSNPSISFNNVYAASIQINYCEINLKVETEHKCLLAVKELPQSDANESRSGVNAANTIDELDKMKTLLRPTSNSDSKVNFFNSLKLFSRRQTCIHSVKSVPHLNKQECCSFTTNYSEDNKISSNRKHYSNSPPSLFVENFETPSFLPSLKEMPSEKSVFPTTVEDYCVLQEQGAGLKGENDHPNKSCEKNLEGFATKSASKTSVKRKCKSLNKILEQVDTLNGDCGEFLEKAANKSAVKTSRKQKSKSNSFINIVNNKSSTSVTNSRDVCDEKLLGTESKYIKKSECDQIVFTEKEKANDDPINGEHLIVNVVNKSNLNGSGDNIIQQVGDLPYVDSNLFPLINLKKCHLKYDDCVKPVINISYESVCKNVLSGLPSVGKILSETMPEAARAALERWKKNMIAQLGEQGFQKLNKENLGRGALFHEYVRRYLVGEASDDDLPEKVHYYFKSLAAVFPRISDVKVVESHVAHPQLQYCGFIDCVAKYDGTPVVIEWKLAEKPKHDIRSTYDAPLQMSAYLGALNYDENYNFPVASGVVVAAYTDGSPANVFYLPEEKCLKYWEGFQNRLQEYKKLKSV